LSSRLRTRAADTPYEIVPTAQGCTVRLDLADERWWDLYRTYGVRHAFSIDATVHGETVAATVTLFGLRWVPGDTPERPVPVVTPPGTVLEKEFGSEGRAIEFSDAAPGTIHSFTAIEATGWLWRQVNAAGLKRATSTGHKIAMVVAAVAAVAGLAGAAAVGVIFLLR